MARGVVQAPGGATWRVTRRVLPWRPRRRMRFDLDPVAVVLGLVALPLLVAEWLVE